MPTQSLRRAITSATLACLLTATLLGAQRRQPDLKPNAAVDSDRPYNRATPTAQIEQSDAFQRMHPSDAGATRTERQRARIAITDATTALERSRRAASVIVEESFGTGGGDIFEIEPNGEIAQAVSLPVNIFGEISFNGDVDFFSFKALAGQQITVEAFAARLRGSVLIPDIVLFDSSGSLLRRGIGSETTDPLIRYVPDHDEILLAGIADIDDFGDQDSDYLLNITRGIDVDEAEPNDRRAHPLPDLPVTVFGVVDGTSDVDFYSFTATAGQTLILDVDAEVLGSRLDAEINLSDPDGGIEYFYSDQADGDDPRFNIVLPYTGRYVIGIGSFNENSSGYYRLNASLVPGAGAPVLARVTRLSKKLSEVVGSGFSDRCTVEINGRRARTSLIGDGTLRAKRKTRVGDVVTVASQPDDRRSNPIILQ